MKTRQEEQANYRATFCSGKTLRFPIDSEKPVTELKYPEFYDISLGNKCTTGRCPWCYASSSPDGVHYPGVAGRIANYFGKMTPNQRPFQVAIGGQQEPLEHPEIRTVLRTFFRLGIVPNITTNGVMFDDKAAEMVKKYCGGIAISCHPHLEGAWRSAVEVATRHGIRTNLHIIVGQSLAQARSIYTEYAKRVEYVVLLPYMKCGKLSDTIPYNELESWLDEVAGEGKLAFGANFHKFLNEKKKWETSLYPPEIFSKYLVCDEAMTLYNNSFEMKPV